MIRLSDYDVIFLPTYFFDFDSFTSVWFILTIMTVYTIDWFIIYWLWYCLYVWLIPSIMISLLILIHKLTFDRTRIIDSYIASWYLFGFWFIYSIMISLVLLIHKFDFDSSAIVNWYKLHMIISSSTDLYINMKLYFYLKDSVLLVIRLVCESTTVFWFSSKSLIEICTIL